MKRYTQKILKTKRDKPDDSFVTCVACLFNIKPKSIKEDLTDLKVLDKWLEKRGYYAITYACAPNSMHWPKGLFIVEGTVLNNKLHCVIYNNKRFFYDPHPDMEGVKEIKRVTIFVTLNPRLHTLREV